MTTAGAPPPSRVALAGDVGGTKVLLALAWRDAGGRLRIERQERFPSAEHAGLAEIVQTYLAGVKVRPTSACFGLAGPVVRQTWSAPNLTWVLDGPELARRLGVPVLLVNDFQAAGYGIAELAPEDLVVVQAGTPEPDGVRALLGAGTGLGEALLIWQGDHHEPYPTEGGHADFAARSELEWRLQRWLRARYRRVSYERILSGRGLAVLYEFLAFDEFAPISTVVREAMAKEDPAAVVTHFGVTREDPLCARTLELWLSIYGAEAGNLALRTAATGGVYVGGGIAPRIADRLAAGDFLEAFLDKGRLSTYLRTMPVSVVRNPLVGLLGAAAQAVRLDTAPSTPKEA